MTAEAPAAPADLARMTDLSGLELMQRMLGGQLPGAPMALLMGSKGGSAGPGWVEFLATPGLQHYNPIGTVHGGYAATLLDSCMGCAVHTSLAAGIGYTTVDLNITYLRAMTIATGEVTARGEVISSGRRIATARGTLSDSQGRTIATGTTTCLVFPLESAK
ncbi:PaaI family thioesterase [Sandarakinorhabdus sp. DWP1-3-1]|uniref:PaaI family thioesterase n=1 Tax=Sandarakinorhabdus sp. DWP1-3-1 TaxID=2804627 RepID=UPI003CE68292